MLDMIFRRGHTEAEAASPDLRRLKKEFAGAEDAYAGAVEEIREIRKTYGDLAPIPAGSPTERRRKPAGLPPKAQRAMEAAVAKRNQARAEIEALKDQIREATTKAMRKICEDARPHYVEQLRKFWSARLARLKDELVAAEALHAARADLEARQVRIIGLPAITQEQKDAAEHSARLRSEVKELVQAGTLKASDIPAALRTAWRMK